MRRDATRRAPGARAALAVCIAAVLTTLAAATVRAAAAPPPFAVGDAVALTSWSALTWSPDGRRLAFVASTPDSNDGANNTDLWLWNRDSNGARRLTRHARPDISPTFSPGGDTIAFVASRGDDGRAAIWMMSLRGGDPWPFGTYAEGVGEVQWSPDGRWLAWVETDTLPSAVREARKRKWDAVVEDERLQFPRLWVAEIATGVKRRLTIGERYVWHVRWSPDSKQLACIVSPTGKPDDGNRQDILVVPREGGAAREVGAIGAAFAWSPDGRWIAWASTADREAFVEKTSLWIAPAAGGAPIDLTPAMDGDAQFAAWNATSDTLFFHAARGVSWVLTAVALPPELRRASAPSVASAARVFELRDRRAAAGAPAIAGTGAAAWVQSDPQHPDEVWIADHVGLPGRPVTSVNAGFAARTLAVTREVSWTSDDGVRCGGLLIRPAKSRDRAALPTLVWLHGGPYGDRAHLEFRPLEQYIAAGGFQIFMPNFRSSGGYGTAFMLRRRADWGGQDWRDVETGIDTLVARGLADPKRLGVYGRSYGGYLSAWAVTQTTRFDAACAIAASVDLAAHYGQSDIQRYRAWEFQGAPWENPDAWKRSSPMTFVDRIRTPTLVIAFDEDRRVPAAQGYQFYRALLGRGVPTQFVHYPREPHVPREMRHKADQYQRVRAWFERWVR